MRIDRAGFPFIAAALVPAAFLVAVRRYALATQCIGGGQGIATILERI